MQQLPFVHQGRNLTVSVVPTVGAFRFFVAEGPRRVTHDDIVVLAMEMMTGGAAKATMEQIMLAVMDGKIQLLP